MPAPLSSNSERSKSQAPGSLKQHRATLMLVVLMLGAYAFDYAAGRELNLWLLYVVPVLYGTFTLGLRVGVVVSLVSGALLFLNGYLLGNPFSSTAIYVIDRLSNILAYLLITLLCAVARGQYASFKAEVENAPSLPD